MAEYSNTETPLVGNQGVAFNKSYVATLQVAGTELDLSGLNMVSAIRKTHNANQVIDTFNITVTIPDGGTVNNQINLNLTQTQMSALESCTYVYEVLGQDPNDAESNQLIMKGTFTVDSGVVNNGR